jgi:hypothetical protein
MIMSAFLLKGGLGGRTILIPEPFVGTHVNVQLIVDVGVRPAHIGHVEVDEIGGLFQHKSAGAALADFLIDHAIAESEGAE